MSVLSHIDNLLVKQQHIETEIHNAYVHHLPITDLKKQRLRIKDQIQYFMTHRS